jgi:hypothetical protein
VPGHHESLCHLAPHQYHFFRKGEKEKAGTAKFRRSISRNSLDLSTYAAGRPVVPVCANILLISENCFLFWKTV